MIVIIQYDGRDDTCVPKKRYIFSLVNLVGDLRGVLGMQVGYIIIIDTIY